jgi:hypothetical protein
VAPLLATPEPAPRVAPRHDLSDAPSLWLAGRLTMSGTADYSAVNLSGSFVVGRRWIARILHASALSAGGLRRLPYRAPPAA